MGSEIGMAWRVFAGSAAEAGALRMGTRATSRVKGREDVIRLIRDALPIPPP
jgi:hypothetical protein